MDSHMAIKILILSDVQRFILYSKVDTTFRLHFYMQRKMFWGWECFSSIYLCSNFSMTNII